MTSVHRGVKDVNAELQAATIGMSFSDTESVFLDVAILLEILQRSPFH